MSKHFEDGQYDDDLTIGLDDFNSDDLFSQVDLLKYKPSESPLENLKSLVLSLDWEISDEILRQFNEELIALRKKWTDEKIYLVYIQILEIVSKYIYQERSSANPNAIRLLPAFYYNFDKIVLDDNLTDAERQDILFADVKRFNNLKKQIFKKSAAAVTVENEKRVIEVEKINAFKKTISSPVSSNTVDRNQIEGVVIPEELPGDIARLQPAFTDIEDDDVGDIITSRLDEFLSDEPEVEGVTVDKSATGGFSEEPASIESETETRLDSIFNEDSFTGEQIQRDAERALEGVNVAAEGDDEFEEDTLPTIGDEIAPALADYDEESSLSFIDDDSSVPALAGFDVESAVEDNDESELESQLALDNTLDDFFDDFGDTKSEDRSDLDSAVVESVVTPPSSEQVKLLKEYFDDGTGVSETVVENSIGEPETESVGIEGVDDSSISLTDESVQMEDCFVHLRRSIEALGFEIETQLVNDVFDDMKKLRQSVDTTTLAKSFLQLLSTVVQYIDRNRYSSSDMAYDLVLSVFAGLEDSHSLSAEKGSQLLLAETHKVLQWQQNLIYVAQAASPSADVRGERLTTAVEDDLRSEIETLRKTFRNEINQLRNELLAQ